MNGNIQCTFDYWIYLIVHRLIDAVNREIGVCQSSQDKRVLLLLDNVRNMHRFQLIHLTTPKYKVAYGVNRK